MLVTEIQTASRNQYNSIGDTFFSDSELNSHIFQACKILAREALVIQRTYSATTVAGQQTYSYPTNTLFIKRVTYFGKKLKRVTHRQDDALTLSYQNLSTTGFPIYYTDFNYQLSLRPIPDDAQTLLIYSYNLPQVITNTSTLEVPDIYHMDLVDYVVSQMAAKDTNFQSAQYYRQIWEKHVIDAKRLEKKRMRGDSFATVQDESTLPVTIMGEQ